MRMKRRRRRVNMSLGASSAALSIAAEPEGG